MAQITGQDVGEYQVIQKLSEGGMAEVYKAVDLNLDREAAIKFLWIDTKDNTDWLFVGKIEIIGR